MQAKKRRNLIAGTVLAVLLVIAPVVISQRGSIRGWIKTLPFVKQATKHHTADDQIAIYGERARARWKPVFDERHLAYPPERTAFVVLKDKYLLQVYVQEPKSTNWHFVRSLNVLGASGKLGPKLKEGDGQVPEGIYDLSLEPNTPFHLALRLNYPNTFDRTHAEQDDRDPGSDILIHGSNCSIGCLAMGDEAAEDLFVLAYDAKTGPASVIIAPVDFRAGLDKQPEESDPAWLPELYNSIRERLKDFPSPR